jgi:putative hemolysin
VLRFFTKHLCSTVFILWDANGLQSLLFARDPWLVIARSIKQQCPKPRQLEALAYLEQSKDFYIAATGAGVIAARPLALYYSFMNLAKAFCLTRGGRASYDQAQHGISEQRAPGARELIGAFLRAFPSVPTDPANVFDEFMHVLSGAGMPATTDYQLPVLLPQIVPGHRFWAQGSKKTERFIAIHDIQFWHDPATRAMWLRLYFVGSDLSRLSVTQQRMLDETRLAGRFGGVTCNEKYDGKELLCFEQVTTHNYTSGYPADEFQPVIDGLRDRIWVTVATVPPYRRYYVYLAPTVEHPFLLPQILSIYALIFYLGSITRYRPHQYDAISVGLFGPWIQEFVSGQPLQFLYLLASEFARQEVTRPSIL